MLSQSILTTTCYHNMTYCNLISGGPPRVEERRAAYGQAFERFDPEEYPGSF